MIVYPQSVDDTIRMADWACQRLKEPVEAFGFNRYGQPLFQCLGFGRDDKLLCVVVVYHVTEDNAFVAFASDSPRWASKENIAALGDWVFNQMGKSRVTATVKKGNKRARKFDEGIGFKVEGKLRRAVDGKDMMIYGLLKDEHEAWLRKAFHGKGKHNGRSGRSV